MLYIQDTIVTCIVEEILDLPPGARLICARQQEPHPAYGPSRPRTATPPPRSHNDVRKLLRTHDITREIPVVIPNGNATKPRLDRVMAAGAGAHLPKVDRRQARAKRLLTATRATQTKPRRDPR